MLDQKNGILEFFLCRKNPPNAITFFSYAKDSHFYDYYFGCQN